MTPIEDGGTDSINNAIPLCPSCHDRAHVKPSRGRTTRDYTTEELKLHLEKAISDCIRKNPGKSVRDQLEPGSKAGRPRPKRSAASRQISVSVHLSDLSKADCRVLSVSQRQARAFIKSEAKRHPLLFKDAFLSLPLIYGEFVLLLSWDRSSARVERILSRTEAYPSNDNWSESLRLYRRASLLPYRNSNRSPMVSPSESKRILGAYRSLVTKVRRFLRQLAEQPESNVQNTPDLEAFLSEAEMSLSSGQGGIGLARLEGLLSNVHKILLKHAPQGVGSGRKNKTVAVRPLAPSSMQYSVLVVDDEKIMRELICEFLEAHGFRCSPACSADEAMRLLVDRDFDLILTDLMMPGGDGREVALAAKNSGSRAKIFVVTGFTRMATRSRLGSTKFPCDKWIEKPFMLESLLKTVQAVLRSSKKSK